MKKGKKIIGIFFGAAILVALIVILVQYKRGWFTEIIPESGYGETNGSRKFDEIIDIEDASYWDGDWALEDGSYKVEPEGVILHYTVDATITHGTIKFVLFDLGEEITQAEYRQRASAGLGVFDIVYEQEITKTGIYQMDFDKLNSKDVYLAALLTKESGNEYHYTFRDTSSAPRWYRIHDKWLAWLPFVDEKWTTCPKW